MNYKIPEKYFKIVTKENGLGQVTHDLYTVSSNIYIKHCRYPAFYKQEWYYIEFANDKKQLEELAQRLYNEECIAKKRDEVVSRTETFIS